MTDLFGMFSMLERKILLDAIDALIISQVDHKGSMHRAIVKQKCKESAEALREALDRPAEVRRPTFADLCNVLPEGVTWGWPINPDLVRHIIEAVEPKTLNNDRILEIWNEVCRTPSTLPLCVVFARAIERAGREI